MKKPVIIMLSIIISVAVLCAAGVGVYYYLKHETSSNSRPLTVAQQAALQVTFPQMTTNLETDGLIQFTMTLQASDKTTKTEIGEMIPDIQDIVNRTMLGFTANDLKQVKGFDELKDSIMTEVNKKLQSGRVTKVDFSQIVIQ